MTVAGTGLKPEITFASNPPMPQDELLSRILFGTSITNLSAPEALQLASAVAAFQSGKGSLDPINALRKAIGLDRLRIVPADVATGQKTAIGAGKYIRRKLFIEVVTDGQGYSATNVEYQMTRWLSLLSTVSTIGRSSASVRVSRIISRLMEALDGKLTLDCTNFRLLLGLPRGLQQLLEVEA